MGRGRRRSFSPSGPPWIFDTHGGPNPQLVAEAHRLRGTSLRPDRSLREIAIELDKLGYRNERCAVFSPPSIASMLA